MKFIPVERALFPQKAAQTDKTFNVSKLMFEESYLSTIFEIFREFAMAILRRFLVLSLSENLNQLRRSEAIRCHLLVIVSEIM